MGLVSILLTSLLIFNSNAIKTAASVSPEDCVKQHNEKVLKDIQSSFPELKILDIKENVHEYRHKDLDRSMIVMGGKADPYLESLRPLYTGTSIGDRRFFVVTKHDSKDIEGFLGYFLYKESDGTNILIKMKPGKDRWEIVEQKREKGTVIEWSKECGR